MTNLLDILKEADLRIGFTQHFKSPATRETLDRETLQKRFLLCLYGLGTNAGIKRVSMGDHGQSYQELLYTRRRYLQQGQLRAAIVDIANATFQARLPHIWGEGTTTCASDSTPLIYSHVTPYGTFRLDLAERIPIEEEVSV